MIEAVHYELGNYLLHCENADALLFTENESNFERLWAVAESFAIRKGFD